MTTRQTPDAVREAYRQGQIDMRERAAQVCDQRGAEEQEGFGLVRGTQNYFRARNAVRNLEIAALDSRAGDAGEGKAEAYERRQHIETLTYLQTQYLPGGPRDIKGALRAAVKSLATPAPAVDALPSDGTCSRCGSAPRHPHTGLCATCADEAAPAVDAVPAGEVERFRRALREIAAYPSSTRITSDMHCDRETLINIARIALSHGEGRK